MIKANELRVGNLLDVGGNKWSVNSIIKIKSDEFELYFNENPEYDHWFNAEPISLTEEWLLKLNKIKQVRPNHFEFYSGEVNSSTIYIRSEGERIYLSLGDKFSLFCEFVHDFQNAIFVLTGEELTIK